MEQTNPELFNEVCEAGIGSSRSSNMDDSELSNWHLFFKYINKINYKILISMKEL